MKRPEAHFSSQFSEIGEATFLSGNSSSGSILRRISKALATADEPVHFWLDTVELASHGVMVDVVSTLATLFRSRSASGRATHFRSVTRSIVGAMGHIVEQATQQASAQFDFCPGDPDPTGVRSAFEEARLRNVLDTIEDNGATEAQLFEWATAFNDGMLMGSMEFRAIVKEEGNDYMMIGIGSDAKVLSEWIILRNERCRDTNPFDGVAITIDPWTLAGGEVQQKMLERWGEGAANPLKIHSEGFAEFAIAEFDESKARHANFIGKEFRVSPGIIAAMADPYAGPGYQGYQGKPWEFDVFS